MCESCEHHGGYDRREFLKVSGAAAVLSSLRPLGSMAQAFGTEDIPHPSSTKKRTKVTVVFMYPPENVVLEGKFEDANAPNRWSTWPGHQYEPEKNQDKFSDKVRKIGAKYAIDFDFRENVYTRAQVDAFIENINAAPPDTLLIFNFWNTLKGWVFEMTQKIPLPTIVYQPLGVSHQLPLKQLMEAPGVVYIHSLENWEALESALAAANAKKLMTQSRLLRVTDVKEQSESTEKNLGTNIVIIPAEEYNKLFDSIVINKALENEAMTFKKKATAVLGVDDHYIIEAFRARNAVLGLMKRFDADGVTIKCLLLKERKPCVAFSLNNSALIPSACEDFPDSALTMMAGSYMLKRGGFMHNPDFDVYRNQYYASHSTCPFEMHGPGTKPMPYRIRAFQHQLPKTAAVDVRMTPGEKVFLSKYVPSNNQIRTYTGTMVGSPEVNIAAGCATRCIVDIDKVDDVCSMYLGPHPILYYGNAMEAMRMKMFAKLTRLDFLGNL